MKQLPHGSALSVLTLVGLAACSNGAQGGPQTAPGVPRESAPSDPPKQATRASDLGPVAVASLKELMDATVDPAADGIWDSVAVISTSKGIENRQPRTPEEWAAVRRHAITLVETMNLVVLSGRHAAPPGTKPGLGELEPTEIERGIAQKRALFVSFAKALQGTALQALDAIDRHDTEAIVKTGGDIDAACEVCHVTFWYPNQQ